MFLQEPEKYLSGSEELTVTVVGAGHTGIPLASVFAISGVKVWLVDIDKKKIETLKKGRVPFYEPNLEEVFKRCLGRTLYPTTNLSKVVKESDVVVVAVGTPLNKSMEPDVSNVVKVCRNVARSMRKGSVLILSSTVPVRTTSDVIKPLLEKISKFRVGEHIGLAFCPERFLEGTAVGNIRSMPKIVGGCGEKSTKAVVTFFNIIGIKTRVVSTPEVSEMAKLLCNAYRTVNIALGNEFSMMCELFGIDSQEVIKAANTSPIVDIMRPGMMGGSCLTKDPYFLISKSTAMEFPPEILVAAKNLNEELPNHVLELIVDAFKEAGKDMRKSRIAILGLSFKGETSDIRATPILPLIKLLRKSKIGKIVVYDPYVKEERIKGWGVSYSKSVSEATRGADCVVVGAEHKEIRKLDFMGITREMSKPPIVIDGKGIIKNRMGGGVIQKGIGFV